MIKKTCKSLGLKSDQIRNSPQFSPKMGSKEFKTLENNMQHNIWLVVSTPLKNISQNGNLPQIGMKIKNI